MQVGGEIGIGGRGEALESDLLGLGRVADPVEGLREAAHQAIVARHAGL